MSDPEPTIEELHADPAHWKLGIFYVCSKDPRVLVPKRIQGLGWTINFARPSALVWIIVISALAWSIVALAKFAGANKEVLLLVKVALAFGIVVFCHRAANSPNRRLR